MSTIEEQPGQARSWLSLLAGSAFRPRRTVRWILDHRPGRGVIPLVLLTFFSAILNDANWALLPLAADHFGPGVLAAIVAGAIILVGAFVVGLFHLWAAIATLVGRLLGGDGTYRHVRTALAWACAPLVFAIAYRIPALLFWTEAFLALGGSSENTALNIDEGNITFTPGAVPDASLGQMAVLVALEIAVFAWFVVTSSRALAEAQGIASWRGFGNLLLSWVLPFVVVILAVIAAVLA